MVITLIKSLITGSTEKEVVLIFCIIGASIQIIQILHRYFTYDYIIQSDVGVPDHTILPDISVCFDIIDMINYRRLFSNYPYILSELGYSPDKTVITERLIQTIRNTPDLIFILFRHLKINQLWDQMINKSNVYSKAIYYQITEDSLVEKSCPSREFFSEQAFCYVFTCTASVEGVETNLPVTIGMVDLYKMMNKQAIFSLSVYQSFFSTIGYYYISLTPRSELPRGEKVKWESQEAYSVPRKHTFFFYSITTHYLKAPYPTDCINYMDKGYSSNADMEDKCQINLGLEKTGTPLVSNILDVPIDSHFGYENFEINKDNATFINTISDIVDYCSEITLQPDCTETIHIITSRNPLPITGDYTEITIEQNTDPIYIITYLPKMTPLDVIIAIGSVLGTWLGFSIAYSIPQLTSILGIKFCHNWMRKNEVLVGIDLDHHAESRKLSVNKYGSRSRIKRTKSRTKHEPFYVYYNQQAWPLLYDSRTRPWWYR